MGVGGIGDGPCGGGPMTDQPLGVTQNYDGTLTIQSLPAYAAMTESYSLGNGMYAFCPATGSQSLVLTVR